MQDMHLSKDHMYQAPEDALWRTHQGIQQCCTYWSIGLGTETLTRKALILHRCQRWIHAQNLMKKKSRAFAIYNTHVVWGIVGWSGNTYSMVDEPHQNLCCWWQDPSQSCFGLDVKPNMKDREQRCGCTSTSLKLMLLKEMYIYLLLPWGHKCKNIWLLSLLPVHSHPHKGQGIPTPPVGPSTSQDGESNTTWDSGS